MIPLDFSVIEQKFREVINEKNRLLEKLKEKEKQEDEKKDEKKDENKDEKKDKKDEKDEKDDKKEVNPDEDFNIYILKEENLSLNTRLAKLTNDLRVLEE